MSQNTNSGTKKERKKYTVSAAKRKLSLPAEAYPYADIGDRLKVLRVNKGMTQEEFYNGFPIAQANISRYERGLRAPTIEILRFVRNTLTQT